MAGLLGFGGPKRLVLTFLAMAYDRGFRAAPILLTDPAFARLRADPRFGDLVDRMNADLALARGRIGRK